MTLRQESLIEAFALSPESLSESETADAIALINSSDEAAALHTWFASFYKAFVHQQYVVSERLERFIDHLSSRPDSVRLVPRRAVRRDSRTGQVATPKLAAATRMHRAFELIGSSITNDGRTDVRFIRNVAAKRIQIYVVTEIDALYQNVLLLFEGSSVLLLTDENGHASIDADLFEQLGLIERPAFIRPLHAQFTVDPKDLASTLSPIGPTDVAMKAQAPPGQITFDFDTDEFVAFGQLQAHGDWRHIQSGACIDLNADKATTVDVRVYG